MGVSYSDLSERCKSLAGAYQWASPYPHAVLRDVFDINLLKQVATEFPDPKTMEKEYVRVEEYGKHTENRWEQFGPATKFLFSELKSGPFLGCVSDLTGINDLIADPLFMGGGQHQIADGGLLKIHADFNKHTQYGLDRRINLLLYLNEDWQSEWGGQLELWDEDMSGCVEKIDPMMGTVVVFSTTSTSYHSHPDPLRLPPGVTRKSLALYYYTNGRPSSEGASTHGTLFQLRPGHHDSSAPTLGARVRIMADRWTPPAIRETLGKARLSYRQRHASAH